MNKIKRVMVVGIVFSLLFSVTSVSAVTLKESFSGGSYHSIVSTDKLNLGTTWKKTTYAQTQGYYGYHYVLAYQGGSSTSTRGAEVSTGKVYSNGNVIATTSANRYVPSSYKLPISLLFKTGYAKYGK